MRKSHHMTLMFVRFMRLVCPIASRSPGIAAAIGQVTDNTEKARKIDAADVENASPTKARGKDQKGVGQAREI